VRETRLKKYDRYLTSLSRAVFALGRRAEAWQNAVQALSLYNEIRIHTFFVYLTPADLALLLVDQGEILQAMEVYRLVCQQDYLCRIQGKKHLYNTRALCPKSLADSTMKFHPLSMEPFVLNHAFF